MKNSFLARLTSSLSLLCALASTNILAQGFEQHPSFNFAQDSFLPTAEAFQVVPNLNNRVLTFHWTIADRYYLYKNQFSLSAQAADKSIALELKLPEGVMKYDEAFDKELEVYYQQSTLKATIPNWMEDFEIKLVSQGCAEAGLCYPPRKQYFKLSSNSIIETDKPRFAKPKKLP